MRNDYVRAALETAAALLVIAAFSALVWLFARFLGPIGA